MTLPDVAPTRKQRFDAALKLLGIPMKDWCSEHYRVSWVHLNRVLADEREGSAELNAAIDSTIERGLALATAQ